MAVEYDSLDLDLEDLDTNRVNKRNELVERIKELSNKVRLTSKERDELVQSKTELESANSALSKERDFFRDFSDANVKFPGASEFRDAILEKVKLGYSVEDATAAVLAKEGKLGAIEPKAPAVESPAGGSAINQLATGGEKQISEMTQEEKLAGLREAEKKGELRA